MDIRRISIVSGMALLALTATASAGPMSVTSSQVITPPTQIEQVYYHYRHHYRHYGWHRGYYRHYGWNRWHRPYYGYGYGYPNYNGYGYGAGICYGTSRISGPRNRASDDRPKRGGFLRGSCSCVWRRGRPWRLLRDAREDMPAHRVRLAGDRLFLQGSGWPRTRICGIGFSETNIASARTLPVQFALDLFPKRRTPPPGLARQSRPGVHLSGS